MATQLDFFSAARVNKLSQAVYDQRLNPQPMVWSKRIKAVPAYDDEIMARFVGFPMIADVIMDDSKAVTYQFGKFEFYSSKLPKIKVGVTANERYLRQVSRIKDGLVSEDDVGVFKSMETKMMNAVRYGVDIRHEAILIGMLCDSLDYNRLGIVLSGLTWQMYSDLKVTAGTTWSNTAATPITDIQTIRRIARIRYGMNYNRITMTTQDLIYMTATTEFINQSKNYLGAYALGGPAPVSPIQTDGSLKTLAERILSGGAGGNKDGTEGPMTIEIDDRRYWTMDSVGVERSVPLHPVGKVILSSTSLDSDTSAWDWAQGENIESVVAGLAPGQSPAVPKGRGTVVYPTLTTPDLNSPGITYWGVECGFSRKHNRAANAVLTAGTYADTMSTALPF